MVGNKIFHESISAAIGTALRTCSGRHVGTRCTSPVTLDSGITGGELVFPSPAHYIMFVIDQSSYAHCVMTIAFIVLLIQ